MPRFHANKNGPQIPFTPEEEAEADAEQAAALARISAENQARADREVKRAENRAKPDNVPVTIGDLKDLGLI